MSRAPGPTLAPALALALTGCAVGPDYVRPVPPAEATGGFVDPAVAAPPPAPESTVAPGTARPAPAIPAIGTADPGAGAWWRLFADPALDRLVADALADNTDVRVALANLDRARAVLSEARGARLPTTTTSAQYQRQRAGAATATLGIPSGDADVDAGPTHYDFDLFSTGIDANYEVDLFGRVRRQVEAARADVEATAADLDAARIAVAAETARSYAAACSAAEQAAVARETVRLQDRTLDLTRRLYEGGRGTQREIDQAQVLAQNARALVPGFEADRRASLYALAALTGRPPAQLDPTAARCTTTPTVTTAIPVGDGAALLARRPDVRAAERRLAVETARIGVAVAELYPSISLGGSASLGATRIGDIGKASSFSFALGPLISWSFPNLGIARARVREARASGAAALATFDGTVLTALRETEQALARYAGALDAQTARAAAAAAAEDAARLSRVRFDAGRDSFLQLLDAERDRAAARTALAQARAATAAAQIDLFMALGGGWEAS